MKNLYDEVMRLAESTPSVDTTTEKIKEVVRQADANNIGKLIVAQIYLSSIQEEQKRKPAAVPPPKPPVSSTPPAPTPPQEPQGNPERELPASPPPHTQLRHKNGRNGIILQLLAIFVGIFLGFWLGLLAVYLIVQNLPQFIGASPIPSWTWAVVPAIALGATSGLFWRFWLRRRL